MIGRVTATEIDTWAKANPRRAQEILPLLMIRLILATSKKIGDFNFPIEKGIQFAGYDGVLDSNENTIFFPAGKSVWEFGTDNDAINKFRDDIEKRSNNSLGVNIKQTTFIFATLKVWNHQMSIEELINKSKANYKWKDIRIIDASKISLWLENCPGVSIWLCENIGKDVAGVLTIEQYWDDCCDSTTPVLLSGYFLLDRKEQLDALSSWLHDESGYGYKVLMAESSLEATLFIIAAIMTLSESNDNELIGIKSKVLIVTSSDAWNKIISPGCNINNSIFIPVFNFTEEIRYPNNISAILPISKYSLSAKITKNIAIIEIPIRTRSSFCKALELLGYTSNDAYEMATKVKRKFSPFYRIITNLPTKKQPKWIIQDNINELIPALLLGEWSDKYSGDKEIIEKIYGYEYEAYIKIISKWLSIEDPPLFTVLGNYQIVSIQDSWGFLFDKLSQSDISALRYCIKDIFSAINPAPALPDNERFMASIIGKRTKYSAALQQGIIISLIMLAERDSEMNTFGIFSTRNYVDALVKSILSEAKSWQQLSAIAPSLPLLAEASPGSVLEKLEQEIKDHDSNLWKLFIPCEDLLIERNYYVHILWALEILVWHNNFAIRAIIVLAEICEKNFKYKMRNSPHNTLYEIFCIWYPQTCLSKEQRLEMLKKICDAFPLTWQLLLKSLLSASHSSCGLIQRPRWAEMDIDFLPSVTAHEYDEVRSEIIKLSLARLSNSTEQWKIIIEHIGLYESYFEELKEKCIKSCEYLCEKDINIIAGYLRDQIYHYRKFRDANESNTEIYVLKLEQLYSEINTNTINTNTINKYKYLFTWQPSLLNPIPCSKEDHYDYGKDAKVLFELRSNAVEEILKNYEIDVLIDFCNDLENTNDLGVILAEKLLDNCYNFDILNKIRNSNNSLYISVLRKLISNNALETLIEILQTEKSILDNQKGEILCYVLQYSDVWPKLELFSQAVADYYWEYVQISILDEKNVSTIDFLINKLLAYSRPFSAIQIIAYSHYNNSEIIIHTLEKCLQLQEHKEARGISMANINYHNLLNLFEKLYENQNIDELTVVRLEISYLSYFKYNDNPKFLMSYLQKNPKIYISFMTKCFRPDELLSEQPDNETKIVDIAYDVLHFFKSIPGCNESLISLDVFNFWISEAREYAALLGYCKAFEQCLGKLLSYSPVGTDGIFPHEIVRDFLEINVNPLIVDALIVEKQNQRGVYTASGGLAEKRIASEYYNNSKVLNVTCPRTSAILIRLGDYYSRESKFEQQEEMLDFRY